VEIQSSKVIPHILEMEILSLRNYLKISFIVEQCNYYVIFSVEFVFLKFFFFEVPIN